MSYLSRLFALSFIILVGCENEPVTDTQNIDHKTLSLEQMITQNNQGENNEKLIEGIQALREKDFDRASRIFNSALLDDPKSSALHTLNAFTYHLKSYQNDSSALSMAESGYSQAKKFDPNNTFAILELGRIKAEQGNYIGAQDEFAEVLMLDPQNKYALYELANASYLLGDMKTAVMAADRLMKVDPKPAKNLRACALIYAATGRQDKAQYYLDLYLKTESSTKQKNYVTKRVAEWHQLHKEGKITVSSAGDPNFDNVSSDQPNDPSQSSLDTPSNPNQAPALGANASVSANNANAKFQANGLSPQVKEKIQQSLAKRPTEEMVVVDAVVLRVSEQGRTSKGNNIINNFTVTLAPYSKAYAKNVSSPIGGFAVGVGGATVNGLTPTDKGNSKVFAQGISVNSIAYSLNIANVNKDYIEVIGRPTLVAIKSKPAEFFSGTDVKVALSGNFGGNVASSPFGNTLKVTLVDIQDGYATLDVDLQGSLLATNIPVAVTTANLIYQVDRSQIKTSVKVKLGETIMLAGTSERVENNSNNGFPGLKDIPIIQYFFSNETTNSERKSVMYLMTIRGYKDDKMRTIKYFNEGDEEMERPNLNELENRYKNWFDPQSNNIVILRSLAPLYRDFRVGDFVKLRWDFGSYDDRLEESLTQIIDFLWY